IDNNVPNAVNQFFLNGGSDAYVVGLKPQNYTDNNGRSNSSAATVIHAGVNAENAKVGIAPNQIQFTALEPTDQVPMTITISNVQQNAATLHFDTADIVITYGVKTETLRKVKISDTDHTVLEGSVNGVSSLVTVAPTGPNYPADFPHPGPTSHTLTT